MESGGDIEKGDGEWVYLFRAVDAPGQPVDFLLSAKRNSAAARGFPRRAFRKGASGSPRTITVDKNTAYPIAVRSVKQSGGLWRFAKLRQLRYLNNIVEQDYRRIKRLVRQELASRPSPQQRGQPLALRSFQ